MYGWKSSIIYMFVCMVAVPLAVLITTYGSIIVTVMRRRWNSREVAEMTSASNDKEQPEPRRQRQDTRLIVIPAVITALFVANLMPIFVVSYMSQYYGVKPSRHLLRFIHVIFYFHPIFNSFVYFFVDARFLAKFVRLFRRKNIDEDNMSMASVTEVAVVRQWILS